jgi:hypothetical protein
LPAADNIPNTLPATQNFDYLREKGLQYIQQLSGKLWTDHNLHDPGITILEVLCYALMDLGYRSGFGMKDIITEADGKPVEDAFHTAENIFPSKAVTLLDYRKLLVDIDGIRNAWLLITGENGLPFEDSLPMYAWCNESRLLFEPEIDIQISNLQQRAHVRNNERIRPEGLYAVKLDMDEHPLYGDLNSTIVPLKITKGDFAGYEFEIVFPAWFEMDKDGKELVSMFAPASLDDVQVALVNDTKLSAGDFEKLQRQKWTSSWTVKYGSEERILGSVKIKLMRSPAAAKGLINGIDLIKAFNKENGSSALNRFRKRPAEIFRLFGNVRSTLMQNRNLCEDFLFDLRNVDTEDLSICVDVDTEVNADLETIQADIFLAVENYLLPPVQFSTLQQLLDDGVPVEEVFNGPVLSHGFLTDDAINKSKLKQEYYTSDIISLLIDIPGVSNVRNFQFAVYKNDVVQPQALDWKIAVLPNHKLRLAREKCKLLFYKKGLPLTANFTESINKLRLKTSLNGLRKYNNPQHDLPVPSGKYRDLAKHYTILNEFPRVYGLGEKDLAESVSPERKAQVKQLEGYLTFFDQLIAGYFAQLNHIKYLLSWKQDVDKSYVAQYFYSNADAASLFTDLDFIKTNNGLQKLVETDNVFVERRNRILDHLVSRFAESFNDYALYMYALPDEMVMSDEEVGKKILGDKIELLKNYPVLSSGRATAFNYAITDADPLNTTNLAGYARRMRSLLGMNSEKSKPLHDLDEKDFGGFHLLEHFLLRPFTLNDKKLSVCLDLDCDHCGDEDPYSSRVSIILPFWLKRFTSMAFRNYMETLFREEAPAHLLLKICWVDPAEMKAFEEAYSVWIKTRKTWYDSLPLPPANIQTGYSDALNKLIDVLEGLRTDFPAATLHDCADRDELNDTRVFLGSTLLGTFNPTHEDGKPIEE